MLLSPSEINLLPVLDKIRSIDSLVLVARSQNSQSCVLVSSKMVLAYEAAHSSLWSIEPNTDPNQASIRGPLCIKRARVVHLFT